MELIFKICAATLVCVVLLLVLNEQQKYIAILICIVMCCMIVSAAGDSLVEIIKLMKQLQRTAGVSSNMLSCLFKSVTVALTCEITSMICTESGYGSLGKILQFAGSIMILYFSLPLFELLLNLASNMLGGA